MTKMAAKTLQDTRIWVKYYKDEDDSESFDMKEIIVRDGIVSKALKQVLLDTFSISQEKLVVKLRNARGYLVPINAFLASNSPTRAYTLEICRQYNNVKPRPRTVIVNTYQQLLERRLQNINHRLRKLEQTVPELPAIQGDIIQKELKDLDSKMIFLNTRIKDAEQCQWQGMFQKNPLW